MKHSRQRDIILSDVLKRYDHPTAEMIYESVRKEYPNISLGTVYRNLNLLVELGNINKINMPNSSDRFDGALKKHSHLYCDKCKSITDIVMDDVSNMYEKVEKQNKCKIISHDIMFIGICINCKKEG